MGSRGKKRIRKDGSIASGRLTKPSQQKMPIEYDDLEIVPPDILGMAVALGVKHKPLAGPPFKPVADWDYDNMFEAIDALAEKYGVDDLSLGARADALLEFLRVPDNQRFFTQINDDDVQVDSELLAFAATSPMNESNAKLQWAPSIK